MRNVFLVLSAVFLFVLSAGVVIGADFDNDGFADNVDVCPYVPDPTQADSDGNGVGNACFHSIGLCGGTTECFCGDTMTENFTMVRNLRDRTTSGICPDRGLHVGLYWGDANSKQLQLNCNGFEIRGIGFNYGISIENSFKSHEIYNCTVDGFLRGIYHAGGGLAFRVRNSRIFNNTEAGIMTVGSGDVGVYNTSIYENTIGINIDETLRYEIADNHIFSNRFSGIFLFCQTPWTTDLNRIIDDRHRVYRNVVEYNEGTGIHFGLCSNSTLAGNIIRNNSIGLEVLFGRSLYRYWNNSEIVQVGAIGRDRTKDNFVVNNTAYNNSRDLHVVFADDLLPGGIDYTSPYYEPFLNYFENNNFSGKEILYVYNSTDSTFSSLSLDAFICFGCTNVSVRNSNVSEVYLGYSNDFDAEPDFFNITSDDPFHGITKVYVNGTNFADYLINRPLDSPILEYHSFGNTFTRIVVNQIPPLVGDCVDQDGDGYGVCPNCGTAGPHYCQFNAGDCDDSRSLLHPGQRELFNFVDDDCDGKIDFRDQDIYAYSCLFDFDHSGTIDFFDIDPLVSAQGSDVCGFYGDNQTDWCSFNDANRDGLVNTTDINLFLYLVNGYSGSCNCAFGPELCDGYDNDCDNLVDEVFCCGDGFCGELENSDNCQVDCGFCGDGVCDTTENCSSCSSDCTAGCGGTGTTGGDSGGAASGTDGSATSGGGSSGGGSGNPFTSQNTFFNLSGNASDCDELWSCGQWSACLNETRTRSCLDIHHCGTLVDAPSIEETCTPILELLHAGEETVRYDLLFAGALTAIGVISTVTLLGIRLFQRKKEPPSFRIQVFGN